MAQRVNKCISVLTVRVLWHWQQEAPFPALKQSGRDSDHFRVQRLRITGVTPTPLPIRNHGVQREDLTFPAYKSMNVRNTWQNIIRKYAGRGGCSSYSASSETVSSRAMKNFVHT